MTTDDLDALLGLTPLAVGDRVRVRLSGECPEQHQQANNGALGTLWMISCLLPKLPHSYIVWLDHTPGLCALKWCYGCVIRWPGTHGRFFARAELSRLEAHDPRRPGRPGRAGAAPGPRASW